MDSPKPIHTLILDSGPILKNDPAVSTLVGQSEALVTVPAVIAEIRDATARPRLETTLLPFLTLQDPNPGSLRTVSDFARETGDYEVLSRTDLLVLALTYEIECERNGGDWRLRKTPGQRRLNGAPPKLGTPSDGVKPERSDEVASTSYEGPTLAENRSNGPVAKDFMQARTEEPESGRKSADEKPEVQAEPGPSDTPEAASDDISTRLEDIHLSQAPPAADEAQPDTAVPAESKQEEAAPASDESDDGGWITPSNIKKRQAKDQSSASGTSHEQKVMQAAALTTDFAMQNVLLQMNLNLLSPSLQRVRHLKTYILRCHACFATTKDMTRQFCSRCGKPTMLRVSCSTHARGGEFRMHLKKNMQWNTRGDRYSIPKVVGGSASGKINVGGGGKGGGKGGWGQSLILAEDQKEYQRALKGREQLKVTNLLDEDYLPGIFAGERARSSRRPKVGAGRDVNSKRRR